MKTSLFDQSLELCVEIEKLPAGEQQTKCSLLAASLRERATEVERACKEVHDRMHYLFEPDCDGGVDQEEVRNCVNEYLEILGKALKIR